MKPFIAGVALAALFSAEANANLWSPDFVLGDETNPPLSVPILDGLTFQQCIDMLEQSSKKTLGFSGSCFSPTQGKAAKILCTPSTEREGYHACYMIGFGLRSPE